MARHEAAMLARLSLAATLALSLLACREPRAMKVELAIEGMTCESCVQGIEHQLGKIEGVASCEVDLAAGKATVEYREGAVEPEQLAAAVDKLGYEAEAGTPTPIE
ncbi:heavy-metal-associated domain-containing protein [Nannocystaceae bacterium ST9]